MERFAAFTGVFVFIGLAYLMSENRSKISWPLIGKAIGIQILLALSLIGIPSLGVPGVFAFVFEAANSFFIAIISYADKGSSFLFGPLINTEAMGGYIFAVKALPIVIFFSSLMGVGYHLGIMQFFVKYMALAMHKTLKISGAEALATSANVFIGQTEAPVVIRPFIPHMTNSEIFCLMVGGMATVAGTVLGAFVEMLSPYVQNIGGHLLTASVVSAPAAIMFSKIMVPESESSLTQNEVKFPEESKKANLIEAAAEGAGVGVQMALNIGAMLLAFIALVAMANAVLFHIGEGIGFATWGASLFPESFFVDGKAVLSFEFLMSLLFMPFAFFLGIPANEIQAVAGLLGEKVIINEFYAYINLASMADSLSDKTVLIASYALCGFANLSSIGIQIGGIGALAPNQKSRLAKLGIRSVIAGSLAAFTTASIASVLL